MTTQKTILPMNELDELLKEKKSLEAIIAHYREEYKKSRLMVRDNKKKLREVNLKIGQLTRPTGNSNNPRDGTGETESQA